MKRLLICLVGLIILLAGCSKEEEKKTPEPEKKPKVAKKQSKSHKINEEEIRKLRSIKIKEMVFSPINPNTGEDLSVKPVFEKKPEGEYEGVYSWVVNKNEIAGNTGDKLARKNFKKGDWIHVRLRLMIKGKMSRMYKSKFIRIASACPIIEPQPLPEFKIPGIFSYKIKATDPGNMDESGEPLAKNTLKYELISPKDEGIEVNGLTGEINWFIDDSVIQSVGESVTIIFKVTNKEGAGVKSSITLNFGKKDKKT